jgi:mycothiol synthase
MNIRNVRESDIPALTHLVNLVLEHDGLPDRVSEEMIRFQMSLPLAHPEEDFFAAVDDRDEIVGMSLAMLNPRTGSAFGNLAIHPDHRRSTVGAELLQHLEAQMLKRGETETPSEKPVYLTLQALDTQDYETNLLQSCGYEDVRTFYEMAIVFDAAIEAPTFPSGIEIRPFDRENHARAVHAAQQEAFRDHWGHAEDSPFEEWVKRFENPRFKSDMYYIAWDGNTVAGVALCAITEGETDMGSVDILGVRRPYRKQGLGMALLRYAFHRFQQQGLSKGHLGVDASSKTNAVALYERAGMHINRRAIAYRKVLRGNSADIID